jgi:carbonic anhydrase/acetyltransferase-like protein (isoleucine patch superfamily)
MAVYALGDREPQIDPSAYVHPQATVIGDVIIGPESTVWPQAVIRGDDNTITIGAQSSIQDGAVIHCTSEEPTKIGDRVTVGHLAHLEGCTVHDDSLIGSGSVVLHRAEIGPNALVGAAAMVVAGTEVSSWSMALGVPATIRRNALEDGFSEDNVSSYVERGRQFAAGLRRID